jgi:hypothetical protein
MGLVYRYVIFSTQREKPSFLLSEFNAKKWQGNIQAIDKAFYKRPNIQRELPQIGKEKV